MPRHIIRAEDLSADELRGIFAAASTFKERKRVHSSDYRGLVLASMFYEPSTRTRFSHEAAMLKLGGSVMATENALEFSSAAKDESLEDAIHVISGYADVIVFRNKDPGSAAIAASVSEVPLINGGDGNNEHPTQTYLDLYTILEDCPDAEHILFFGDNQDSRTVRSLAQLIATHGRALGLRVKRVTFAGPHRIGECAPATAQLLEENDIEVAFVSERLPPAPSVDVVYVTRSQKERRPAGEAGEVLVYPVDHATGLPSGSIIMHPLPRNGELPRAADQLPQARYFEQAKNGLYVRMALLEFLLDPDIT